MGKPYSMDLRERVVAAVETGGLSCHQAAAQFGVGVIGSPQRLASTNDVARGSWIRCGLDQGACPPARRVGNIPPKRNRKDPICFSPYLYRARNLIERFFNKIKQCRRVATRYDKLAANYLAFVKLASIRIWLRANESAP
jgi:Transposase DDE domain